MALLITLFLFVTTFSLLTVGEVLLLRRFGFDIIAHLKTTLGSGKKGKFFLEAFGATAFVLGQPVILMVVVVWAFGRINPELHKSVAEAVKSFVHYM